MSKACVDRFPVRCFNRVREDGCAISIRNAPATVAPLGKSSGFSARFFRTVWNEDFRLLGATARFRTVCPIYRDKTVRNVRRTVWTRRTVFSARFENRAENVLLAASKPCGKWETRKRRNVRRARRGRVEKLVQPRPTLPSPANFLDSPRRKGGFRNELRASASRVMAKPQTTVPKKITCPPADAFA
ncbi:hypothetical protein CfE428DRAFT_6340 [Chthoniobacter flavus Ellin428]|uniref:Uncharacterized protein n=1 Tax=Chthoniobacter flavus Ellin428 TaxID=497964 RepID=B4DBP9_9BACT|nr:hypothetical protein CfE428DRAFT_6340 [Chthoniobacter flavus Ellin428]